MVARARCDTSEDGTDESPYGGMRKNEEIGFGLTLSSYLSLTRRSGNQELLRWNKTFFRGFTLTLTLSLNNRERERQGRRCLWAITILGFGDRLATGSSESFVTQSNLCLFEPDFIAKGLNNRERKVSTWNSWSVDSLIKQPGLRDSRRAFNDRSRPSARCYSWVLG